MKTFQITQHVVCLVRVERYLKADNMESALLILGASQDAPSAVAVDHEILEDREIVSTIVKEETE